MTVEEVEAPMIEAKEVDLKLQFRDFFKTFKDKQGKLKYWNKILDIAIKGEKSLIVDFPDLLLTKPDLALKVLEEPRITLEYASEALKDIVRGENPELVERTEKFYVRFRNLPRTVPIRKLGAEHIERLVQIEGIITRMTPVIQRLYKAVFKCLECGSETEVLQEEETIEYPELCGFCEERKRTKIESRKARPQFKLLLHKSRFINMQKIIVQEKPEDVPPGHMPRSVEVVLLEDLVDKARPGDRVTVVGILTVKGERSVKKGTKLTFEMKIEANSLEVSQKVLEEIEISKEDERKILELAKDPNIREKIVQSIAPAIHGYNHIKKAIALLLFGGVPKELPDGTRIRGDIHILLVGDPGVAKSQILQYIARIAPRGLYTSGKGSSAAGLTAAVIRDKSTGDYFLEAGALVLADGGICAIDEIDKMRPEDRVAIHEAMEQQSYHKDFEILLADGEKVKIGEFVDQLVMKHRDKVVKGKDTEILFVNDIYTMAYDVDKKTIVITKADRISRHKAPNKFIKITFSNGRSITVTPEHPVLIWRNGEIETIRADKVKPGMITIGVNYYELMNGSNKYLLESLLKKLHVGVEDLGKFIGFLLSDGYTYANPGNGYYEIGFANTNTKLIKEFENILKKMKVKYSVEVQGKNCKKPLHTTRIISKDLFNMLKKFMPEMFIDKENRSGERPSRLRRVPKIVFKLPIEGKKAFINAFFKGDGFVDSERIGFRTSSWSLAQDLQDILLTLNIYSYIERESKSQTYYKVVVSGTPNIEKIAEILKDDHRVTKITKLLNRSRNKHNYRDELPYDVAVVLRDLANELDINDGYLTNIVKRKHQIHRLKVAEYIEKAKCIIKEVERGLESKDVKFLRRIVKLSEFSRIKNIPYSTLRYRLLVKKDDKLLEEYINVVKQKVSRLKLKIMDLENIVNGNIRFVKIKSIEEVNNSDSEWVYDITVEPYHLFVSHGLVLHNTISIAKAGIVARLNARTAILAAGNPKFGRYIEDRLFTENINLPPTILSRFDLIFVMRDKPAPQTDEELVSHILTVHKQYERVKPPISPSLLRKYVGYARKYVKPRLTEEAAKIISDFFVNLRSKASENPNAPIPITPRQLEAIIRLAEAHARMVLRNEVTAEDAKAAIDLVVRSFKDVGLDIEAGVIDIDIIMTGKPVSRRLKIMKVMEIIEKLEEYPGAEVKKSDVIEQAVKSGLDAKEVEEILDQLRREGSLYEPRLGKIARTM